MTYFSYKRNIKIIGLYTIGILLVAIYYQIDGSSEITKILKQSHNRGIDSKFGMYTFIGMLKNGCLVSGDLIIVLTTIKGVQLAVLANNVK